MAVLDPHNLKGVEQVSRFAVQLSAVHGSSLCGLLCEEQILDPPGVPDRVVTEHLLRDANEHKQAIEQTRETFRSHTAQVGLAGEVRLKTYLPGELTSAVIPSSRLYDCSVVSSSTSPKAIEEIIFQSGRPIILVPDDNDISSQDVVLLAWDGSRSAARAVHDALPILQRASVTEVITITGERNIDGMPSGEDLVRHLQAHSTSTKFSRVEYAGGILGEQILEVAERYDAKLLVMGAFGLSRLERLIFGGATRTVIKASSIPVFLSY